MIAVADDKAIAWSATYEDARRLVNGWSNICIPIKWEEAPYVSTLRGGAGREGMRDGLSDLHAGNYNTGNPKDGWTLYSRLGGPVWQQLTRPVKSPLGCIGDRVWVREPYSTDALTVYPCPKQWYQADFDTFHLRDMADGEHTCGKPPMVNGRKADCFGCWSYDHGPIRWRSAQTMPRVMSRFDMDVVFVDVGRLEHKLVGMSPEDWNARHRDKPWAKHDKNPWVFAYTMNVRRRWSAMP